jgi:uncharacterized repeat protein (TIGR01451 family)
VARTFAGLNTGTTAADLPNSIAGANCLPQLTVAKSTSTPSFINAGGTMTAVYTIVVTNTTGLGPAQGVTITDQLPTPAAGTITYAGAFTLTLSGGATRTAVVDPVAGATAPAWGTFDIPGGGSVAIQFTVDYSAAVPNGIYQNPATVSYLDPTRSTAGRTISPATGAGPGSNTTYETGGGGNVPGSKAVNVTTVNVGQNVTFTVVLTNSGPSTATNVAVSETLPAGLTFVSATPSQGTYNSGTGLWTVGTLPAGTASLQIVATVTQAGALTNTAQVATSDQPDPDSTPGNSNPAEDDQSSATVSGQQVDLRLSKRDQGVTIRPGDLITYTLAYTNAGNVTATGVVISETVPVSTTFSAAASLPTVWSCADGAAAGSTCTVALGSVAAGASGSVTFSVRVANPFSGTQIANTAAITDDGSHGPDPTPSDNIGARTMPVLPPTAVDLLYFRVDSVTGREVHLAWATATEIDNFGFNLYRAVGIRTQ